MKQINFNSLFFLQIKINETLNKSFLILYPLLNSFSIITTNLDPTFTRTCGWIIFFTRSRALKLCLSWQPNN
jgi:hypothetical protein